MIDKTKVYSFEGNPCIVTGVLGSYATGLVLTKTLTTVTATMITIPIDALEPWQCPYAEDTAPRRAYCDKGICQYPMPETAPFAALTGMCMRCLIKSFKELEEEENNAQWMDIK